jgi:hypothetical protein
MEATSSGLHCPATYSSATRRGSEKSPQMRAYQTNQGHYFGCFAVTLSREMRRVACQTVFRILIETDKIEAAKPKDRKAPPAPSMLYPIIVTAPSPIIVATGLRRPSRTSSIANRMSPPTVIMHKASRVSTTMAGRECRKASTLSSA